MEGDEPNAAQIDYWNSPDRQHWIDHVDQHDEMLGGWGAAMLDTAEIAPSDVVLDVGCGCGATAIEAARRASDGRVLGIDVSKRMVAHARERAEAAGITNVRFMVDDAQTHPFEPNYNVVTSRFGIMFFADPVAAFSNLRRALAPGGRVVFVCWQALASNPWMQLVYEAASEFMPAIDLETPGQPGPFSLAEEGRLRRVLSDAELPDIVLSPVEQTIVVGGSGTVDDVMRFYRGSGIGQMMRSDQEPEAAQRADDAVRAVLEAHYTDGRGVEMQGAAWVVSASR